MKKFKCPRCKKSEYKLVYQCALCGQHLHLECKECGYNWNEWVITDKKTCCGDVDRYPWRAWLFISLWYDETMIKLLKAYYKSTVIPSIILGCATILGWCILRWLAFGMVFITPGEIIFTFLLFLGVMTVEDLWKYFRLSINSTMPPSPPVGQSGSTPTPWYLFILQLDC